MNKKALCVAALLVAAAVWAALWGAGERDGDAVGGDCLYAILELPRGDESRPLHIRQQRDALTRAIGPPADAATRRRLARVRRAYAVLSDRRLRIAYDTAGMAAVLLVEQRVSGCGRPAS
jgi:hypothetical protein